MPSKPTSHQSKERIDKLQQEIAKQKLTDTMANPVQHDENSKKNSKKHGMGLASQVLFGLIGCIAFGGFIGYLLDMYFNTKPFITAGGIIFGFALFIKEWTRRLS